MMRIPGFLQPSCCVDVPYWEHRDVFCSLLWVPFIPLPGPEIGDVQRWRNMDRLLPDQTMCLATSLLKSPYMSLEPSWMGAAYLE